MTDEIEFEKELRAAAARFDPVPAELLQYAIEGFRWRTIDAELAKLTFDSLADTATDPGAGVGGVLVRGTTEPRLLTFRAGELTIELEINRTGASRGIVGQLLPPMPATVEIRQGAGAVSRQVDDLGRFSAPSLPAGPTSLRCRPDRETPEFPPVVTDWVSI